jgi:hypothetical protein
MEEEKTNTLLKHAVARWTENAEMSDAAQDNMIAEQMQSTSLSDTHSRPSKMQLPFGPFGRPQSALPMHRRIAQLRCENKMSIRHLQQESREVQEAHKVKRRRTNSMDLSDR